MVIQFQNSILKPNLARCQGAYTFRFHEDVLDGVLGDRFTARAAAAYRHLRKVHVELQLARGCAGAQRHRHHLGLAIGIHREVHHLATLIAGRQWISLVSCDALNRESLDVARSTGTIAIDQIIYRSVITFLEYCHVDDVLTDKLLVINLGHHHCAVLQNYHDVIDIRTIAYELVAAH